MWVPVKLCEGIQHIGRYKCNFANTTNWYINLFFCQRVNSVAFNDESTVLISGSFDATIRLWDLRSSNFQPIQVIEDCKDSVMSVDVQGVEIIAGYVSLCIEICIE